MKRDWDVIRNLLIEVEELTYFESYDLDSIEFEDSIEIIKVEMADLLLAKGFFTGERTLYLDGNVYLCNLKLTWDGHELLDTLRDKNVWNRIKEISKEKGIDITFESIKIMLGLALTSLLT
ncbi:DUF2513 domain-containing protein [Acinetobacter baumannii]|uniref:DUF2513 domain-containing protein n=1 Tax=Acinetobacter baumannii TaxID=470 RepID=UPI001901C522|nr:DUF2513 domain-containing protein [Acinetobacter baumannii]MBJ9771764.1 DUF2513 domain-containing protein [Acinetobacter baumannii]MDC5601659.1 DUF2513 domain-containing protein [Acinetobacter baumannii]MDV7442310.1 DUF2513 domain-containing protein [Acinetobacter baumannii]